MAVVTDVTLYVIVVFKDVRVLEVIGVLVIKVLSVLEGIAVVVTPLKVDDAGTIVVVGGTVIVVGAKLKQNR